MINKNLGMDQLVFIASKLPVAKPQCAQIIDMKKLDKEILQTSCLFICPTNRVKYKTHRV